MREMRNDASYQPLPEFRLKWILIDLIRRESMRILISSMEDDHSGNNSELEGDKCQSDQQNESYRWRKRNAARNV